MFLVWLSWNEEERWVQDFLLVPQGFKRFLSDLLQVRWRNLVFLSPWCLVFLLLWIDATLGVGFEKTCIVSGKWNVSRVDPSLYGWVCKTLRLSLLGVEHTVVVWLRVPNQDYPRLNPMVSQFLISVLPNLCSESARA